MPTADFYSNVNFRYNELRNAVIHRAETHPPALAERAGQIYFNTLENALYVLTDEPAWERLIDLNFAATHNWGFSEDYKSSVKVATTPADLANATYNFNASTGVLTIMGLPAGTALPRIDQVEVALQDRILIKDMPMSPMDLRQFNGIWQVQLLGNDQTTLVLKRPADSDTNSLVTPGMLVPVERGVENDNDIYQLISDQVDINVTPQVFNRVQTTGQPHQIVSLGPGLDFPTADSIGLAGITAINEGDLLIGGPNSTFTVLPVGNPVSFLIVDNNGDINWWNAAIPGVLGGTGLTSIGEGSLLLGAPGNTYIELPPGNIGDHLIVDANGHPTWAPQSAPPPASTVSKFVDTSTVDGSDYHYYVVHNLNTEDVVVNLWDISTTPAQQVLADISVVDADTIWVGFSSVQDNIKVVVIG